MTTRDNLVPTMVYLPPDVIAILDASATENASSISAEARRVLVAALRKK